MESARNCNIRRKKREKRTKATLCNAVQRSLTISQIFDDGNGAFRDFRVRRLKSHSMSVKTIHVGSSFRFPWPR